MAEKPILFNTEMVGAILDGRKTQTRRLVNPRLKKNEAGWRVCIRKDTGEAYAVETYDDDERSLGYVPAPYQPGDVLWVRETWDRYVDGNTGEAVIIYKTHCRARKILEEVGGYQIKWRPSIHMPREAARLFLRVTSVRVERLQDMTEDDAYSEGYHGMPWCFHRVFDDYPDTPVDCIAYGGHKCPTDPPCDKSIPELFGEMIWNPTVKKADLPRYGWNANPWVWVYEFERCDVPNDA